MKVKTYRAQSIKEAVAEIKQELGSDALILSTRQTSIRRPWGIRRREQWEVTAGVPDASDSSAKPERPAPSEIEKEFPPISGKDALEGAADGISDTVSFSRDGVTPPWAREEIRTDSAGPAMAAFGSPSRLIQKTEQRMEEVLDEIDEIKRSVRFLGQALPQLGHGSGNDLFAELVAQRLEPNLVGDLMARASKFEGGPDNTRVAVRALLADLLPTAPQAELETRRRVVSVFVGPTGVGKTTTVAKIAGRAAARHGKKVALISTDTHRVTGQEQLVRFGQLLGVPVFKCSDLQGLKGLVESLDEYDLILVDTAGCSPSDRVRLGQLQSALDGLNARVHLVVSATTKPEDVTRIAKRFGRCAPESAVVTKIDETDTKGAVFGELMRGLIPVSYISDGQRVPENLLKPTGGGIAHLMLPARWEAASPAVKPRKSTPKVVMAPGIRTGSLA